MESEIDLATRNFVVYNSAIEKDTGKKQKVERITIPYFLKIDMLHRRGNFKRKILSFQQ